MEVNLVQAGAGFRYAMYAGACAAFLSSGIEVAETIGTSAGSINAGMLAAGHSPENILRLYKELEPKRVLDKRPFFLPLGWKATHSRYKGNKLLKAFQKHMPATFDQAVIPTTVVAHSQTTRTTKYINQGSLPLAVRASISLPIFDMVEWPNKDGWEYLEDGGWSANFPLDYAGWQERRAVIGLHIKGMHGQLLRQAPKTRTERLLQSFNDALEANERERIEDAPGALVITLRTPISGLDTTVSKTDIQKLYDDGYEQTMRQLEKSRRLLGVFSLAETINKERNA